MPTTFTYIKDAANPLLNIRVATDEAGFDDNANRAAIARYTGFPASHISAELDGRVYALPGGSNRIVAYVTRVVMDIAFDTAAH